MKRKAKIAVLLLLITVFIPPVNPSIFWNATRNYEFSIFNWEVGSLVGLVGENISFWEEKPDYSDYSGTEASRIVITYLDISQKEIALIRIGSEQELSEVQRAELSDLQYKRKELEDEAKYILRYQVQAVLQEEGIFNPFDGTEFFFPPINFEFEYLPRVLVISERGAFKEVKKIFLSPDITLEEIEQIESAVDKLGFSSLVVPIGGLSTYPTLISPGNNYRWIITTIAHEWVHTYMFFKPLGRAKHTSERQPMEETTANIVGKEIANSVWAEYYEPYMRDEAKSTAYSTVSGPVYSAPKFDFNSAMRQIRKNTEILLAQGKIDEAEAYMREQRDWLEENGYRIRKLNQAYFVFHGYYADSPAHSGANGGVGSKLLELRSLSVSLKEFLLSVSAMENAQDLDSALQELKNK
ncbi:MAG: hypothetical protein A2919_01185 [Candidatus Spechtbacteria bacterium RIFCSPLOWO2_01_FULL_43_12]|uniref:Uncharacterized protein n=1 Tax=Candidatus Spechtbacteria bacterium RIFCSPLOWO2_01_FULL_43_12 TaxID=1802162 RepID=A0A1G2HF73_9BACT|nr:MAG: hypothetical protein A2919_01185 [Candidatus Spechtbacteria bacterium RIFCSPLOWO2_01_FULL_43_12]